MRQSIATDIRPLFASLAALVVLIAIVFLVPWPRCGTRSPQGPTIGEKILISGCAIRRARFRGE
jgi:hypothetical protein